MKSKILKWKKRIVCFFKNHEWPEELIPGLRIYAHCERCDLWIGKVAFKEEG